MAVRSAKVEEVKQIIDLDFMGNIEHDPKHIRNFFTSNIIQKTLSLIAGLTTRKELRVIKVTEDGTLVVATSRYPYTQYKVYKGTADANGKDITFDFAPLEVLIQIEDSEAAVSFIDPQGQYGDEIELKIGTADFAIECKGVKIKSLTSTNTKYQIIIFR